MSIVKQIHALTEKLTGQTGAGYDITESINDLTKKWTGSSDRGETIAESLDVLVDHAESGGGGGGATIPVFTGDFGGEWSCDTTYSDLYTLIDESVFRNTSNNKTYPCVSIVEGEGAYADMAIFDLGEDCIATGFVYYYPNGTIVEL